MSSWSDALLAAEREMWDDVVDGLPTIADEAVVYDDDPVADVVVDHYDEGYGVVTSTYGAVEVNTLTVEQKLHQQSANEVVDLADKRLARITRLRLVTDRDFPMWDLSYCYGTLKDGSAVRVRLPQSQFPKQGLNQSLVEMCKAVNVYGKGLGIFDPEVISKLYG